MKRKLEVQQTTYQNGTLRQNTIKQKTCPIVFFLLEMKQKELCEQMNEYVEKLNKFSDSLFYSEKRIIDLVTYEEIARDEIETFLEEVEGFLRGYNTIEESTTPSEKKTNKLTDEQYELLLRTFEEYTRCKELYIEYCTRYGTYLADHTQMSYLELIKNVHYRDESMYN